MLEVVIVAIFLALTLLVEWLHSLSIGDYSIFAERACVYRRTVAHTKDKGGHRQS